MIMESSSAMQKQRFRSIVDIPDAQIQRMQMKVRDESPCKKKTAEKRQLPYVCFSSFLSVSSLVTNRPLLPLTPNTGTVRLLTIIKSISKAGACQTLQCNATL